MAIKQEENERPAPVAGRADRWLDRAIRITAILLAAAAVAVAGLWYFQRYVHPTVSVVDRDTAEIELQIRDQPNDPELRVAAANLYIEKGRLDAALDQAEQVLAVAPDHLGGLLLLGRVYAARGEPDRAAAPLERVLELNRDNPMAKASLQLARVHEELAGVYLTQNRAADAVREYQEALAIDRGNADTLHLLGKALITQGQLDDGIAAFRQALRLVPDFPEVYGDLYRAYEQKGALDLADYAFGMVRYSTGEYEQAVRSLERAARVLPDDAAVHLGLAMAYEKQGQREAALAEYRRAAALEAGSIAARQGIGRMGGQ